jgi:hypothetical protein
MASIIAGPSDYYFGTGQIIVMDTCVLFCTTHWIIRISAAVSSYSVLIG